MSGYGNCCCRSNAGFSICGAGRMAHIFENIIKTKGIAHFFEIIGKTFDGKIAVIIANNIIFLCENFIN